ncbi:MAG: PD40 domain-containing protein [Saprospiraceae bacterium]|nr:PD40 domain-containing protein [Saprospiraceae bacterium]
MPKFRIFWLLGLLIASTTALQAQKPAELKRAAERAYENGRWHEAQQFFSQYQALKPGETDVLTKLGIAHYQLHEGDKARQLLEYVASRNPDSRDADLFFYLARTLHGQSEFDKAIAAYKSFLRAAPASHPLRAAVADNIRRCLSGMDTPANEAIALVENLGNRVNSPGDEFSPIPSVNHADRLYYAAARDGSTGGQRNDDGYEDAEKGHWCSDIFAAQRSTAGWETSGNLGGLLNTSRFEIPLGFNENGQVIYYFRGFTPYGGEVFADTAAAKDEYALQPPVFKSPMLSEAGDGSPYFINDRSLLFASRRAGGQGGMDLWLTVFRDTAWSAPVNLGPAVNSPYDEVNPFLAADGRTLYFSSNRTASIGGLDIFKTVFDEGKKAWQAAVNVGTPVNSPGNDESFRLSADGRSAFMASDRLDSYGQRDLYIVYLKEAAPEQQYGAVSKPFFELDNNETAALEPVQQQFTLSTIQYNNDRDLLSADNQKILDSIGMIGRNYPIPMVLVTVHTDETGPAKFDLYYGIKRAEIVGKALTDRGIAAARIVLRSAGPGYPLARNVLDAAPNPGGARMNRRVEIGFALPADPLPFGFRLERPAVSELMAASGMKYFDALNTGLSYRVEVATTRQILTNDELSMFGDMMIESQPGTGAYRYTAGWFAQHDKAVQLRKDLQQQGFSEASVVAYLHGIRISKAEAVGLLKKFPDLTAYIRG